MVRKNPAKPKILKNKYVTSNSLANIVLTNDIVNQLWSGTYKKLKTNINGGIGYLLQNVKIHLPDNDAITLSGEMFGPWIGDGKTSRYNVFTAFEMGSKPGYFCFGHYNYGHFKMAITTLADVRKNPAKPKVYENRYVTSDTLANVVPTAALVNQLWDGKYKPAKTNKNGGIGYLIGNVHIRLPTSITFCGEFYGPWVGTGKSSHPVAHAYQNTASPEEYIFPHWTNPTHQTLKMSATTLTEILKNPKKPKVHKNKYIKSTKLSSLVLNSSVLSQAFNGTLEGLKPVDTGAANKYLVKNVSVNLRNGIPGVPPMTATFYGPWVGSKGNDKFYHNTGGFLLADSLGGGGGAYIFAHFDGSHVKMALTTQALVRANPSKPKILQNRYVTGKLSGLKLNAINVNQLWNGKYKGLKYKINGGIGYLLKDAKVNSPLAKF